MRVIKSPLIMVRKAGLPSKYNFEFGSVMLRQRILESGKLEEHLQIRKTELVEIIETMVQYIEDDNDIKKLINLKRAIYNLRPKFLRMADENHELLTKYDLVDKVNEFKNLFSQKEHLQRRIKEAYEETLDNEKNLIYDAFKNYPEILKGVNFVQPTIVTNLMKPEFLANFKLKNSKTRNMGNTLGKVITRVAYKASPFSTLTSVGVGEWKKKADLKNKKNSEYYENRTVTRFNQAYGLRVFEKVLALQEIKYKIPYTFADTLVIKNGKFYYTCLKDDGGKVRTKVYKTLDQLVIVDAIKSIEKFYNTYNQKPSFSYDDFKSYFADLDYSDNKIMKLFDRLVEKEFLVPVVYLRQQADCIIEECLNKIKLITGETKSTQIEEIIEKLVLIKNEVDRFDSLDYKDQLATLGRISNDFRHITNILNMDYIEDKSLLYQDSLIDEKYDIDEDSYEDILKSFVLFGKFSKIFDVLTRFQLKAGKSFYDQFGEKEVEVSKNEKTVIDTFINEIVGNSKFWDTQFKLDTDDYGIEELNILNAIKNSFIKDMYSSCKDKDDEINISEDTITKYITQLPASIINESQSNSFFFQNLENNKVVLNHLYAGNAIFYLRFLKNLNEYMNKDEYQSYIKEIIHKRNIIDIYLGYGFNANLRDSITEDAINLPNNRIKDTENFRKVYDWKDAKFKYNPNTKKVDMLFNNEKKVVQFLGTLTSRLLPGIPGMLHIMNSGVVLLKDIGSILLYQHITETYGEFEICKFPRIFFNDNVVISRKKWLVNAKILKVYNELGSNEYLESIIRFFNKHGLPRKMFAYKFLYNKEDVKGSDNSSNKPQYVDVSSPILVNILKRIIENSRYIVFEEVLPDLDSDSRKQVFNDEKTIEITMMED